MDNTRTDDDAADPGEGGVPSEVDGIRDDKRKQSRLIVLYRLCERIHLHDVF